MTEPTIEDVARAIDRVVAAIEHAGPKPSHHHAVMNRHRREWPTLWAALDELRAALDY